MKKTFTWYSLQEEHTTLTQTQLRDGYTYLTQ